MPAKPTRLGKQEVIDRWSALSRDHPMQVDPISYNHKGSSFDQDSIRITGSQEFIDSVLARLSDLLEYDSNGTRLHVMYTQTLDRKTQELSGAWGCYVQVHERGQGRFGGGGRRARKAAPMPAMEPEAIGSEDEAIELDDEAEEPEQVTEEPESVPEPTPVDPPIKRQRRSAKGELSRMSAALNAPFADPPHKPGAVRYALAYVYDDGHEWAEPNGGVGCDTYDDEDEARDSVKAFERTPGTPTDGLQVVRVRKNGKGKMEMVK